MSADIATWYEGKTFSTDWTTPYFSSWTSIFATLRQGIVDVLEIGSWEGRSAIFWLNYFPSCKIVCIDTFGGSLEHQTPEWAKFIATAERHFDYNLSEYGARVRKVKSTSRDALAQLGIAGSRFDFVYVDGSHRATDAYADGVLAWPMVRPGGFMLFDDYTWAEMPNESDRPKPGIDAFLRAHQGSYRELHRAWQILIEKVATVE